MDGVLIQATGLLAALVFCIVRVILDFQARRFGWAWGGVAVSILLLCAAAAPVQTHAVKVDPLDPNK